MESGKPMAPESATPERPHGVTAEQLMQGKWAYGHDGQPPSSKEFTFLRYGLIGGYQHHNEQSWRIEDGVLSLFDHAGARTVRFDDVRWVDGWLALRGKYLLAPQLNLTLALQQIAGGPAAAPRLLGYWFNDGGLSNQKLTLLGLFKVAHERGCALTLPNISIMDQVAKTREALPFEHVFDAAKIKSFAQRHGIQVVQSDPTKFAKGGWEYFGRGTGSIGSYFNLLRQDPGYAFPVEFIKCLVPQIRESFLLHRLIDEVFGRQGIAVAAQFRIEADWQTYTEGTLRPKHGDREDFLPPAERIVEKIVNTFPGTRRIYVTWDEAALTIPAAEVRAACRAKHGVELVSKSDLLSPFEMRLLTPLGLSMLDFEMALRAPVFVGNTRSTFSNGVTFEKFCLTGAPVTTHYVYNPPGDVVVRRTDNGTTHDPAGATRGAA